jgi:hypothetical protein
MPSEENVMVANVPGALVPVLDKYMAEIIRVIVPVVLSIVPGSL